MTTSSPSLPMKGVSLKSFESGMLITRPSSASFPSTAASSREGSLRSADFFRWQDDAVHLSRSSSALSTLKTNAPTAAPPQRQISSGAILQAHSILSLEEDVENHKVYWENNRFGHGLNSGNNVYKVQSTRGGFKTDPVGGAGQLKETPDGPDLRQASAYPEGSESRFPPQEDLLLRVLPPSPDFMAPLLHAQLEAKLAALPSNHGNETDLTAAPLSPWSAAMRDAPSMRLPPSPPSVHASADAETDLGTSPSGRSPSPSMPPVPAPPAPGQATQQFVREAHLRLVPAPPAPAQAPPDLLPLWGASLAPRAAPQQFVREVDPKIRTEPQIDPKIRTDPLPPKPAARPAKPTSSKEDRGCDVGSDNDAALSTFGGSAFCMLLLLLL